MPIWQPYRPTWASAAGAGEGRALSGFLYMVQI